MADPKMESPYAGDWAALDHVEVKDDKSGVIVLKAALPAAVERRSRLRLRPDRFTEGGRGRRRQVRHQAAGAVRPLSAQGMAAKAAHGAGRNPDWPGEKPEWDEIHVIPIEDEKVAELAFEGGDLDYTWVAVSSIPRYRKTPPKDGKVVVKPSLAYVWLGMNQECQTLRQSRCAPRRAARHRRAGACSMLPISGLPRPQPASSRRAYSAIARRCFTAMIRPRRASF